MFNNGIYLISFLNPNTFEMKPLLQPDLKF